MKVTTPLLIIVDGYPRIMTVTIHDGVSFIIFCRHCRGRLRLGSFIWHDVIQ